MSCAPSFLEGRPVRLTRFVEMSLDKYYATVNEMITVGRFEHIGHASIRVEGTTAWGVWLRVGQWQRLWADIHVCDVVSCTVLPVTPSHFTG